MPRTDRDPDAFFAGLTLWRDELRALRAILRDLPLTEEFKWSAPVYTHGGANVAILWGFRDRATLGFFKGVLLGDPWAILEAPGENSRSSRIVNFTSLAQIEAAAPTLRAYLAEAIRNETEGRKVEFPKDDLPPPAELLARLEADPDLRAAFAALTPGRRRGWLLHFTTAKQPKTRLARIDKATPRILAGKGMHDR
ncbi:YdeI/OmpD-associated family protein [Paracoccus marinaquae]|uniref:YdeI/OmpD-associated family protein n=1 Tax=Paracoccus marinaquae TaxID=2841926 RepID=A0ABS6ADJ5_9RHOB|nr:YdeI/OmpD-associated family protein [Paracoccus marinaquae]MBU3028663.1 YdeI/OmpD-associated family protein [Paracoccus marinaquae]